MQSRNLINSNPGDVFVWQRSSTRSSVVPDELTADSKLSCLDITDQEKSLESAQVKHVKNVNIFSARPPSSSSSMMMNRLKSGTLKLKQKIVQPIDQMIGEMSETSLKDTFKNKLHASTISLGLKKKTAETHNRQPLVSSQIYQTKLWQDCIPDKDILHNLTREEIGRQEVIFEIYQNEKTYLEDLDFLIDNFLMPINRLQIISQEDISKLFANLEEIRRRQEEDIIVDHIGDVFLGKAYQFYCQNLTRARLQFTALTNSEPIFKNFIEDTTKKSPKRQDFWSYLDLPRRHVQRYPLLLNALLKSTPMIHSDYSNVKGAHNLADELVCSFDDPMSDSRSVYSQSTYSLKPSHSNMSISSLASRTSEMSIAIFHAQLTNDKVLTPIFLKSKDLYHEGILFDYKKGKLVLGILTDQAFVLLRRDSESRSARAGEFNDFRKLYTKPIPKNELVIKIDEKSPNVLMFTNEKRDSKTAALQYNLQPQNATNIKEWLSVL
ncbi:RhoGEF domain-containing protein 4 [Rozella allomycis CSF55]|uniref:RhoGEF domain-containing protein 4 n=1 Tax=Rozella allomycis (strain CSF55) TaxID=988480 RepID=A0A075ATK4_ROZAC|nr:RhoGEF domain-containing protein 4 [Rozella allomycis CSF55]|eukprot:EPZ31882.1 RhoGEF domain-containing protein 4 [Rozella allomycis CSF55]